MQKANVIVRLGGLLTNTVPKLGVTPAEILILKHIHGDDAVVDIRPAGSDKKIRVEQEFERLRLTYDNGGGFGAEPGEERKSIMQTLFPGAAKKLPMTLEEIGIDAGGAPLAQPEPVPDIPDTEEPEANADEAGEGEDGADGDNAEPADKAE